MYFLSHRNTVIFGFKLHVCVGWVAARSSAWLQPLPKSAAPKQEHGGHAWKKTFASLRPLFRSLAKAAVIGFLSRAFFQAILKSPPPPPQSQQQDAGTAQSCPHPPLPGLRPPALHAAGPAPAHMFTAVPTSSSPRQNRVPSGGQQASGAQEQRGDSAALLQAGRGDPLLSPCQTEPAQTLLNFPTSALFLT